MNTCPLQLLQAKRAVLAWTFLPLDVSARLPVCTYEASESSIRFIEIVPQGSSRRTATRGLRLPV